MNQLKFLKYEKTMMNYLHWKIYQQIMKMDMRIR